MKVGGSVSVSIPAEPGYLGIVRAVACGVAAGAGLGIDRIDDLALAVSESGAALLEAGPGPVLDGTLTQDGPMVTVVLETVAGDAGPWPTPGWAGSLADRILRAVAGDVELTRVGDRRAVRFVVG